MLFRVVINLSIQQSQTFRPKVNNDYANSLLAKSLIEKYIPFYRQHPKREPYIETERLWSGRVGGRYLDVVLMEQREPQAVVEVGECDKEKLKELARCPPPHDVYHWPYEEEKPLRVVMYFEPGYEPDRLKLEPVEQV